MDAAVVPNIPSNLVDADSMIEQGPMPAVANNPEVAVYLGVSWTVVPVEVDPVLLVKNPAKYLRGVVNLEVIVTIGLQPRFAIDILDIRCIKPPFFQLRA